MQRERKAGVVAIVVAVSIGIAGFVWLLASLNQDRQAVGSNKDYLPAKTGINRDTVLKHMTSESNTVIFFDEFGGVVSTNNQTVRDCWPFVNVMVNAAIREVPDMKKLKGFVRAVMSAEGTGNRIPRSKAEAILDDSIREQQPKK